MSIFPISSDQVETFTIVTTPLRTFVTSALGATGSVFVSARRSPFERDIQEVGNLALPYSDSTLAGLNQDIQNTLTSSTNIKSKVASFMSAVDSRPISRRNLVSLPIERYTPTPTFTENTLRKNAIRNLLFPYYRVDAPTAQWAYTNYHSMNFMTASTLPTGSVLLYPNEINAPSGGAVSGTYVLTGAFTFDFYVNPRFRARDGQDFHAATLLHLSSCYAVSLVSGTQRDFNGRTQGYRILLQLSHSADVKPSLAKQGAFPSDMIFMSDDNALQYNTWHHVVIRWGTNTVNHGTGTIWVDQVPRGVFVVPSATLAPKSYDGTSAGNPDALCVGNYYEGTNVGSSQLAYFFASNNSQRDGLVRLIADSTRDEPATYSFSHPFNAEFHDLRIMNGYVPDDIVVSGSGLGPVDMDGTVFYLPPFFTPESPFRQFVGDHGGVLQTPFFTSNGTTATPFDAAMAFGVGGHYINLENFVRDFASANWPRMVQMTASALQTSTTAQSANSFIYSNPAAVRRNTCVLPCDDGNFVPNFDLLSTGSTGSYVDDLGAIDRSMISLKNMVSTGSIFFFITDESGSFMTQLAGASPESPGVAPGEVLTILQRTRDNTSNQVTFFDISNLYYGLRIHPGSFVITDSSLTGTTGSLSVTLKDDSYGNLYRADCVGPQATWNSVGNVLYNEGIVVVKSPHLNFFGQDGYTVSFRGEQSIHAMRINVFAEANTLNSSSNPTYIPVSASYNANEIDPKFVYLTNVYLLDDNLNVLMKTSLAQPVVKREGDRYLFKIKFDL